MKPAASPFATTGDHTDIQLTMAHVPVSNAILHSLACAREASCTAVGKSDGQGAVAIYSVDGGVNWRTGDIPEGLADIRIVTCSDDQRCLAAGMTADGVETLLSSADGGSHWRELPAIGTGRVDALSCGASLCMALLTEAAALSLKASANAGQTWSEVQVPVQSTMGQGLWCFRGGTCWISLGEDVGQLFVTTDGGQTWASRMPRNSSGLIYDLTCVDTDLCWAGGQSFPSIVRTGDGGATWSGERVPESIIAVRALSCSPQTCIATGDDGRSRKRVLLTGAVRSSQEWHEQALPGGRSINAVRCISDTRCVAVGDGLAITLHLGV